MIIQRKGNSFPVDPLMRAMARNKTIQPELPKKIGEKNVNSSLKVQEEWRIFNITRQARGLRLLSLDEYLQMKN